ncbi:MAG: hypothetical protein IKF54_04960 [Eubacterium sp.]|nr:hypothetical protein [Eubacterium sp.]
MKYNINKTNYHDFRTISVNRLKARSYFIPYPDRESADRQDTLSMRYDSPKVICLNGKWDFRFYPVPSELPDVLDTDETDFDKIDVPSCWQFRGYDRPFYVNARYQFPYDPPKIPETNKVGRVFSTFGADYGAGPRWKDPGKEYNYAGVYRTFFSVSDVSCRYVLSFLGAASCADVYVNGSFCGYSEGSHDTAEYDVTPFVREGSNELLVVVHRWCTGTYLECQDMFRNNGIFRDVLLRICGEKDIEDIAFDTRKLPDKRGYTAVIRALTYTDTEVTFTVRGHGTDLRQTVKSSGGKAVAKFIIHDAKEWTAETPYLYDLYIETEGCCVKVRAGFREVMIDRNVFLINGRKVKLHGVNHHDTSPVNGFTMTPEEIERDVKLCKEYNIDTIRTSHYPPDPLLLDLCDEVGIYVVDEADVETHGTVFQKIPPSYNRISNDPKWAGHYVDRIKALYQRDKNHPSIIMWSLGNEAGGTFNTDLMYMYLKDMSPLPVHYESAVHTRRKAYDVASEMYPPAERLHAVGEKKYKIRQFIDRPYFLCEYAHAMGVGPGGMEDYWKEIYSYDNLMGGCIWEMNDHAVLHDDGSYTYGGDHGEWEHDGNFCVDGLFYPDRTPSSGAKAARFVYRPLRVRHIDGDTFEVFNTRSFTDGSSYVLELMWSDGITSLLTPDAGPLERKLVTIDTSSHRAACRTMGKDCMLTVAVKDLKSMKEVSREQIFIEGYGSSVLREHSRIHRGTSELKLTVSDGKPLISVGDVILTSSDPYTILFRAPTDNDLIMGGVKNTMAPFIAEKEKTLSVQNIDGITEVKTQVRCKGAEFICTDTYEISDSKIMVTSTLHCVKGKGFLPRFGKAFMTGSSFKRVEYYGRNGESYADMKDHTQIEHVSCTVSDMTEPNIRPQESGNRCDTRWASVSDGIHTVRFTSCGTPFELGIKPYSDRALLEMRHREDETVTGTYITVSAFQQGLGTGICGPGPSRDVCYPVKDDYVLRFSIEIE